MSTFGQDSVLVQRRGQVIGPFTIKQLRRLAGFTGQTLVSFPGTEKWAPAFRVLNINSYEPPVAGVSGVTERWVDWTGPSVPSASPVFDWKAKRIPGEWVDRWFSRVVLFNVILAVTAFAAWSYPPVRIPLQQELQMQAAEQRKHWMPVIAARLKLPKDSPIAEYVHPKDYPAVGRNPATLRVIPYHVTHAKTKPARVNTAKLHKPTNRPV